MQRFSPSFPRKAAPVASDLSVIARIQAIKIRNRLTVADIASMTGYSESTVKAWFVESGSTRFRAPRSAALDSLVLAEKEGRLKGGCQ